MSTPADDIERLLSGYVEKITAGANPVQIREQIVTEHAHLQPELERQLRLAESIYIATTNRKQEERTVRLDRDEAVTQFVPEERVQNLNCPNCGNRIKLVSQTLGDVTCGNCGSIVTVRVDDGATSVLRQAPAKIGRFKILSFLGSGGFGAAYLAHDPSLDRQVAIKIPRAGEFASRNERERFIREAKHAANLKHENIVQVFEVNTEGDYPYIVSEYIEGMTLSERLIGVQISHQEIARLVILIAQAVHHAHEKGIIHRDLKPSNILLDSAQKPYVADFGLARNLAADHTMTLEGEIVGTPAYMSPEQADGKHSQISARSDVYSLGVILYRLLCRENPFRATGRMLIHQVIHDDPIPPRRIDDRIPVDLETITLKAMEKNPDHRYESAMALADDLRRWQNDQAILARPESNLSRLKRWCRRNPRVAGLLATVAALLLIVSSISSTWAIRESYFHGEARRLQQAAQAEANESQRRLADADLQNGLQQMEQGVFSRALLWIAKAITDTQGEAAIHRIRVGMLLKNHPRLTMVNDAGSMLKNLQFSPRGDFLVAGTQQGQVLKINTDNSSNPPLKMSYPSLIGDTRVSPDQGRILTFIKDNPTASLRQFEQGQPVAELQHAFAVSAIDISPSSQLAATIDRSGATKIWNANTGALVTEFSCGESDNQLVRVQFIDDERLLTYRQAVSESEICQLQCWKISQSNNTKTFEFSANILKAYVDLPSNTLLITERDRRCVLFDLDTGLARDDTFSTESYVVDAYFFDDHQQILTVQLDGTLATWSMSGVRQKTIKHAVGIHDSSVDPGLRFVAVAGTDGLVSVYWLHCLRKVGTDLVADEAVTTVAFHPDGRRLAAGGSTGLVRMWDLAGLAPDVPLLEHDGPVNVARINSRGTTVITASEDHTARAWNPGTGASIGAPLSFEDRVSDAVFDKSGGIAAAASMDGTVKFLHTGTGAQIGQDVDIGEGVTRVQFSPREEALLFVSGVNGALAHVNSTDAQLVYKSNDAQGTILDMQISPSGQQIIVGSVDKTASLRSPGDGKPISAPLQHGDPVTRCGFSRDGQFAWTCSTDRLLRILNTSTPFDSEKILFTTWPTCVDYTSQDSFIATTYEGEVTFWKPHQEVQSIWKTNRRSYRFGYCQVDPLDQLALACGESAVAYGREPGAGVALLLDLATGLPVAPPLQHFARVNKAMFDSGGRRVLTASDDHSARIWNIVSDERSAEDIYRQAVILCGVEINSASQTTPLAAQRIADLFLVAQQSSPALFSCNPTEIDRWNSYVQWVTSQPKLKSELRK